MTAKLTARVNGDPASSARAEIQARTGLSVRPVRDLLRDHVVVLRQQLENPSPALVRAIRAYRDLDLVYPNPSIRTKHPPVKQQHRLTDTELNQAIAAYQSGATLKQVGQGLGVSRQTLSAHLKARGIQLRLQPLPPDQIEEAIWLYQSGFSLAKVGEHLGRDASLIHLTLNRAGIQCRDSHGRER
jgi:exonuclease VII small subunit